MDVTLGAQDFIENVRSQGYRINTSIQLNLVTN